MPWGSSKQAACNSTGWSSGAGAGQRMSGASWFPDLLATGFLQGGIAPLWEAVQDCSSVAGGIDGRSSAWQRAQGLLQAGGPSRLCSLTILLGLYLLASGHGSTRLQHSKSKLDGEGNANPAAPGNPAALASGFLLEGVIAEREQHGGNLAAAVTAAVRRTWVVLVHLSPAFAQ